LEERLYEAKMAEQDWWDKYDPEKNQPASMDEAPVSEDSVPVSAGGNWWDKYDPEAAASPVVQQPEVDPYADDSAWDFSGERTFGGRMLEGNKAVVREFLGAFATGAEGSAELADAITNKIGLEGLIDSGTENPIVRKAREAQNFLYKESELRPDEKYADLTTTKLGGAVGSILSFATPSTILRVGSWLNRGMKAVEGVESIGKLTRAEKIAGSTFAASVGAGEQAQRIQQAREDGTFVQEGDEDLAIIGGGAVGLTEMIPLGRIFGRTEKAISRGRSAGIAFLEEGTQEWGSGLLQNAIETGYNPNAGILDGSQFDDFTIGGGAGAIFDFALNTVAGRRALRMNAEQKEGERKYREAEEANYERYRQNMVAAEAAKDNPEAFIELGVKARQSAPSVAPPSEEEVTYYNSQSPLGPVATPNALGELYAYRILGALGPHFPTNTAFGVIKDGDTFTVKDAAGNQYGQPLTDERAAISFAKNLNKGIARSEINQSILDSLKTAEESYSPEDSSLLYRYGYRALSPEANRISNTTLNEAAGTTEENGYIEDLPLESVATAKEQRKGRFQVQMPDGTQKYVTGLTASQKLNLERTKQGLPPTNSFNINEVRDFLGGSVKTLSNPLINGAADTAQYGGVVQDGKPVVISSNGEVIKTRKVTQAEKTRAGKDEDGNDVLPDFMEFQSLDDAKRYAGRLNQRNPQNKIIPAEIVEGKDDLTDDIRRLLDAKNIASEISSPEINQLVKAFTGAESFGDMDLDDQKLFYARLRELPALKNKAKLPVFKKTPFKAEQLFVASKLENDKGSPLTKDEVSEVLGLPANSPAVEGIVSELAKQNANRAKRASDQKEKIEPVESALKKVLKSFNVDPNLLRVQMSDVDDRGEEFKGYFDPRIQKLVLSIDAIDPDGKMTEEQRVNALKGILTHEVIHALRYLDLFTIKEFAVLENAVARTLVPGTTTTYLQVARMNYSNEPATVQVEEAIAELARDYITNKSLIGGKPRSLIERIIKFLKNMRSLMDGYGFQSFEDVLNAVESGKIGARKRGEIRTLRGTEELREKAERVLPERYSSFISEFRKPLPGGVNQEPPQAQGAQARTGRTADFDPAMLAGADVRYMKRMKDLGLDGGRRYSVKDISKLRDEKIPLNVFAEQFADRIKQSDTKLEDANRIAEGFIKEFVDNPSSFLPVVQGDKLSVDAFLRMPDGTMYDPEKLEHADATDQTIQIYNAVKNGTIRSALGQEAVATNNRREEDLSQLSEYLNGNADYSLAEQALIMKGASKFGMRVEKGQFKLVPIADNNQTNIAVLTATEASAIAEELRKGKTLKAAMLDGITSAMKSMEQSNKEKGLNGWKTFKKSDSEEDAAALKEGCAGRKWCTASATSTARSQLQQGDFHVYYKNGEPIVALRTEDGKLAEPPRGSLDGQFMTAEEEKIAEEALRAGRVTGGEDYLHDRDLIADVMAGKHKSWPDLDLFLKTKRKYKVGYGRGQYDLPKPVIDAIEKERNDRHTQVEWVKLGYTTDDVSLPLGQGADFKYIGGDLNITGNPTATVAWLEQFTTALSTVASNLLNKKSIVNVDYIAGNAEIGYRSSDSAKVVIGRINGTAFVRGKSDLTVGESNNIIYVQDDSTVNVLNKAGNVYVGTTDRRQTDDMVLKAKLISSGEIQRVEIVNHGSAVLNKVVQINLSENANATVIVADGAYVMGNATLYAEKIKKGLTVGREATSFVKELGTEEEFANTLDVAGDATIFIKSANINSYRAGNGDDAKVYIKDFAIKDTRSAVLNYDEFFIKEQKNKQRSIAEMVSPLYVFDNAKGNFYTGLNATVKIKNLEGSITVDDNAIVMIENGTRSSSNLSAFVARQQNRNSEVRITNSENFIVLNDKDSNVSYGDEFVFPSEYEQGMYVIDQMFPDTGRRYSRKSTQSPIEDAVSLANEKYADYKTKSEKEFFSHWQKLLKTVGNQLSPTPGSIRIAAKKAINDMDSWLKENPRYADYYEKDMRAVKNVLESRFGPVSDEEMSLFQALNGLTSPNTKLKSNVADALNLFSLYREDGNFDSISLGTSEKGNNVLMYSPVRISGTSAGNKARTVKIIDQIIKEQGSIEKAMDFLYDSVTIPQLHAFKRSLGYKSNVSGVGPIKALVKNATGQDKLIPRMFIFGKKVGAYTLNLTGNHKYTTIDIWESRFIRSYFNGLFQKNTGLPVDAFEHDLFSRFNEMFKEEFDKLTGKDWDPSSLQAMRWFYILNAANKAGYKGASTNDTISEYARKQIQSAGVRSGQGRGAGDEAARRYSRKPNRFYSESLVAFVRPNRASDGTASIPYARRSGGDGSTVRILSNDVAVAKSYIPNQEFTNIVNELGQEAKPFYELAPDQNSAETFNKAISLFKSLPNNKYRASVFVYPAEDYANMRLFLTESGKTGFALKPDGDIVSVFSYEQGGRSAMELAIQSGGRKLDCFDTVLPDFYASHLFSEAGRVKWDDSQAPGDWDKEVFKKFNNGEPDVVMMVYDPVGKRLTETAPQMDYDEAVDAQSQMQAELSPPMNDGSMPMSDGVSAPSVTPEKLDEAVEKAKKDVEDTPKLGVPLYNPEASPEALYVAQNPEEGITLDANSRRRYSRQNQPQLDPKAQAIINKNTPQLPDETIGETVLRKMQLPPIKDMFESFRKNFVFRYARLERQYRENPQLRQLLADTSALTAAEMADHARQFVQRALVYGIPVYQNGMTKVAAFVHKGKKYRGLIEVMAMLHTEKYGNLEPLAHAYATAVRGERLNAEGKLTPVSPGELKVLEQEIAKFINPATGQPIIKEWNEAWQDYNSHIVRYLRDTGILDEAGAKLWIKQSDYIPFYREDNKGNLQFPNVFGGLHTAGQFKAVGNSDKGLNVDMITAITGNIDAAISMGMKNIAQQRIIRDQIKLGMASILKPGEQVGNRNSVSFKVDGKRYTAIIDDPLIYESMLPINEIRLDGVIGSTLRIPATWLRELIIRDPGYMVANMFRDTLSSYVITGANITPVVDTVKGMFSDITELENLGVVGGYDLRIDRDGVRDFYNKNAKTMGMLGNINWANPVMAIWDGLGQLSSRSEAATRLAVYNDVLARTGNEAEAQYQALSVMNYGRRGGNRYFRALTAIVPFLNARAQGMDKLAQAGQGRVGVQYDTDASGNLSRNMENRKNFQRFAIRSGLILAMSVLYYAMVHDDDEYKNATPEARDNYYILPIKKGDISKGEPGLSVRLPIPFEVGILFKVIPERIMASYMGEDTSRDFYQSLKRAAFSTLAISPPQAILPIGEVITNYDMYTGRPVVPTHMKNLLPEQQTTFYTNKAIEELANFIGMSPMKLQHIAEGYGGTLGGYFLQAIDSQFRSGGDQKPAMEWYQYPVIKRFFTTANQPGLQSQFYDLKDYMDGITQTMNTLKKEGRYDELVTFYTKHGDAYEMRGGLNAIERNINKMREQRKMIERMDIDPEQKRVLIEQINMGIASQLTSIPVYRKAVFDRDDTEQ
jgi:hypothetical protein